MRIAFVWEWSNSLDVIMRFPHEEGIGGVLSRFRDDGHKVLLSTWGGPLEGKDSGFEYLLVPKEWDYEVWTEAIVQWKPDLILGWGTIDHKIYSYLKTSLPQTPIGFFLAGGVVNSPEVKNFDVFFVETDFHAVELARLGKPVFKALGVYTDILSPIPQPKIWDIILPAAFTGNKRYELFCDVVKFGTFKALAVGPMNEERCVDLCRAVNTTTVGYTPRAVLRDLYCSSRVTLLTGGIWGGSQRTLLESLSCGIPVVACEDNPQMDWLRDTGAPVEWCSPNVAGLISGILKASNHTDSVDSDFWRQWVIKNFSIDQYYFTVLKGLEQTCWATLKA